MSHFFKKLRFTFHVREKDVKKPNFERFLINERIKIKKKNRTLIVMKNRKFEEFLFM